MRPKWTSGLLAGAVVLICGQILPVEAAPVSADLKLWLDGADPSTLADASGDNPGDAGFDGGIQTWTDKSGTGNHATAFSADRPLYMSGTLNGSGAVQFDTDIDVVQDDSESFILANTNVLTNETMFFVTRMFDNGDNGGGFVGSSSLNGSFKNDNDRYFVQSDDGDDQRFTNTAPTSFQVVTQSRKILNDGFWPWAVWEDGATQGGASRVGNLTVNTVGRSNAPTPLFFRGQMAEVLIYARTLNTAERVITENYLSAKYLTALAANDKYAGDAPAAGNYDFDVFGIGRDVASNVNINQGPFDISPAGELASGASGGLGLDERNDSLSDGDYLLAGHDGTPHGTTASDVPGGVAERWSRVFFLDVTGGLDALLTFDFAAAGLGSPGNPDGYTLLYRSGISGTFTDLGLFDSIVGNTVQFNLDGLDDLDDGYYTIGAVGVPEPTVALMLVSLGMTATMARRRRFA